MYNINVKTTTQNILLVGFGENAFSLQEDMTQHFSEANFQNIDRLADQSSWLSKDENAKSTQAIICDFDYMVKHDFMFLRNLQNNTRMVNIPFILINKNNMPLNVVELLGYGVDDCYSAPIDWVGMKTRVHFLEKYKPFIVAKSDLMDENPLQ